MALVTILRKKTGVNSAVAELIHESLSEQREVHPMNEEDWIRVSSIGEICPREEVLCSKENVIRTRIVTGDQGINFALGTAIHWLFQNRALAATGCLVGAWRCTWCGETYGGRQTRLLPRPDSCIRCGAIAGDAPRSGGRPEHEVHPNAFIYVEEFVGNEEWRIGGHPDGYLATDDPFPTLLEFKSANERNFGKYKDAPDFIHAIQAQVYMWLTGLKRAKVIYLNKNGGEGTFLREHNLDYDPEVIERVQSQIKEVRAGLTSRIAPARTVCARSDCMRAMGCKVKAVCFKE